MYGLLHKYRFDIFFGFQLAILFGSLLVPVDIFEETVLPMLLKLNMLAGILLVSRQKHLAVFLMVLLGLALSTFGMSFFQRATADNTNAALRIAIYMSFYLPVTVAIIKQVWRAEFVDRTVIIGVMSGYVSLGIISFLLLMAVELHHPGSFSGELLQSNDLRMRADATLYYAYITLLTIGYGEIIPVTPIAQKVAILTGLMGQFYLVIITAVIVGKYVMHQGDNDQGPTLD